MKQLDILCSCWCFIYRVHTQRAHSLLSETWAPVLTVDLLNSHKNLESVWALWLHVSHADAGTSVGAATARSGQQMELCPARTWTHIIKYSSVYIQCCGLSGNQQKEREEKSTISSNTELVPYMNSVYIICASPLIFSLLPVLSGSFSFTDWLLSNGFVVVFLSSIN